MTDQDNSSRSKVNCQTPTLLPSKQVTQLGQSECTPCYVPPSYLGSFHPEGLVIHHKLTRSSHLHCRSNRPEWETRCKLRQDCCCLRHLSVPGRRKVKEVARWQTTTLRWLSVLPALDRGLTSRVLTLQNCVSLEMRRKVEPFFHPSRLPRLVAPWDTQSFPT